MSKWSHPPIIKIYEALGSVADGRIEVDGNSAKVYSSSGNKFYNVSYDPEKKAIMTNDNGSFWKGYLGYPAIAFLLKKGILSYDEDTAKILENIKWKDINQKFKNDFDKTLDFILSPLTATQKDKLTFLVQKINKEISELDLSMLGKKVKPPEGY
jgi:hypothetical protein